MNAAAPCPALTRASGFRVDGHLVMLDRGIASLGIFSIEPNVVLLLTCASTRKLKVAPLTNATVFSPPGREYLDLQPKSAICETTAASYWSLLYSMPLFGKNLNGGRSPMLLGETTDGCSCQDGTLASLDQYDQMCVPHGFAGEVISYPLINTYYSTLLYLVVWSLSA